MRTARRVIFWLAPDRRRVGLALFLTAVVALLNLPTPLLVRGLIDRVVTAGRYGLLPAYLLGLLAVFALQAGVSYANTRVVGRIGQGVVRELRHRLYDRLQRLSLSYYDRTPSGSIIARLMDDVSAIQVLITAQTVQILTDLGTTLAITVLLVAQNYRLALVVGLFLPIYALNFHYFMARIRANSTIVRSKMDLIFGLLKERIDGTIVIKTSAQEPLEIAGFAALLADAHIPRVRDHRLSAAFSNISAAISGVGVSAVFAAGAWEVLQGRMTPGGAVSTAALALLLFGPVARLADLTYVFEQAAASVDRLGEILDLAPDVDEPVAPLAVGRVAGHVTFDRVGFGYQPDQPVVWDIRLDVPPGTRVALVGPTGCGKSTLINLLLRFYDPTWGEIRLDGVPLRQMTTADIRRQVGVVLQEPVLFRQTLADNIRYGAPDATDAQVEAAARAAMVHDFALKLPEGYQTLIGEGGHKLSHGERQRVAIARAFCKDPAIVILDEATSALDTANEALIQTALKNLLWGRTSFVIAHRLVTIVDSERIVVMDGGLIVEQGTHQELVDQPNGLYRALCLSQFEVNVDPPDTLPPARKPHSGTTGRVRSTSNADRQPWT